MWSLSLVMSECSLSGRGQGHVGNFYIVNLENFATASRWYTGDIHNTTVVGLFMTPIRHGWVHMFTTHRHTLSLQLHNFDLSYCTVTWQFARFQLTRCIVRSLGDSWAYCDTCNTNDKHKWPNQTQISLSYKRFINFIKWQRYLTYM